MQTFTFLIKGSQDEAYDTVFYFDGKNIGATCTCPAGNYNQYCKHRIDILMGDTARIISENSNEIVELLKVFKGTPLDLKMQEMQEQQKEVDKLKEKLNNIKKEVAQMMYVRFV